MYVEMPIGAFVSAMLVLVPLPWHWRARNVPTLSIIAWLFFSNIIFAVNSIIWSGNVDIVVPVWCDIVTKIQVGATIALPSCCLCICIHLERIASTREVQTMDSQRRWRMVFDLVMCWGIPIVYMALHYIVQGHRFDIVEDFGCRPAIYTSIQSILIIWTLPLIVVTLTFIYAGFALRHFFLLRLMFARHLQNSNSALTPSRYMRLMAMAIVQMFWGAVVMVINVAFTCRHGLRPWTSWADVHSNFSRIAQFPTVFITLDVLRWTQFTWWTIPISAFFFFVFFSFGADAVKEYKACIDWVSRIIFRRQVSDKKNFDLPSFVRAPVLPPAKPKMTMISNDTKSTLSECDSSLHKARPASFDSSSSFVAIASTIAGTSFPTCDSNSTIVAPSSSLCAPTTHPIYLSLADEQV